MFEAGYGLAEMVAGGLQLVGGAGGEVVGTALDMTGVGALVGVPVNVASLAVIAQGSGNAVAGFGNFVNAVRRDPDPPKQSTTSSKPSEPTSKPAEKPPARPEGAEPPSKPAASEPPPKPSGQPNPTVPSVPLRAPNLNSEVATLISKEGGLTEMANKVKQLGRQKRGVTIEIALATTKEGKQILVAGINTGARKGFNAKQLEQLKEWGVNVAPQYLKEMKKMAPHAEENIASFLKEIGANGVRWSKAVVGEVKAGGSSYVCEVCKSVIRSVGGRVEDIR